VRDLYAFLPLLLKYVDLQRSHWLKSNTPEAEQMYHCVAGVFSVWSKSQYMRKEEANFISANEIDNMALIMPSLGRPGRPVITKSDRLGSSGSSGTEGGGGGGGQKKKKKRDGKRDKDKELAASLMVSALKKLLPVGLNLFAGREQELVQYAKEKLLKREDETDIFEYIKLQLNLPEQIDPSDAMSWQHYLYSKLGGGGAQGDLDGKMSSQTVAVVSGRKQVKAEDKEKMQERLVARIIDMSKVLFGLHMVSDRLQKAYLKVLEKQHQI
jgi:ryanodine receptor 2